MSIKISASQEEILSCFVQTKGFYLMGPIEYPSGRRGPFNIDTMMVLSEPKRAKVIGQVLADYVKNLEVELIIGIATAGIPLAALISQFSGLPFAYVRGEISQRTGEILQGQYWNKKKAVLVDDVIGRGGTKDRVLKNLANRFIIKDLVVMMEGGSGYQKLLEAWEKKTGITTNYLVRWDEATAAMMKAGAIPPAVGEMMLDYLKNPDVWQNNWLKWEKFTAWQKNNSYKLGEPIL